MTVTAAQAIANYNANHSVAPQLVADSAADILAHLAGLQTLQTAGALASVTLTGTSNIVTASQAEAMAGLSGFTVGAGAGLTLADSASNLLSPSNAAGLAFATSVMLEGANNISAAQAETLGNLSNFALDFGATLQISDSAADLLTAANAAGLGFATSVSLTGIANSVTSAQAVSLADLTDFSVSAGATLAVSDTAAHLLTSTAGLGFATSVTLSGTANNVTAAQASWLATLANFTLAAGATLVVSDTAAHLLAAGSAAGEAAATGVVLTGTANMVTATQAAILAGLNGFSIAAGAKLAIADTAADLLNGANAAGLAIATSISITGAANSVSAAQAETLAAQDHASLAFGATLAVSDGAANLLANPAGVALATSVSLTGTFNSVSASQAATLAAMHGFTLAAGATLAVADVAVNLLASANAAGVAAATSVSLTGTSNLVTAAQAESLSAMAGFGLAAGAALIVSDSAAHLLSAGNTAGVAAATSVVLTGANNLDAAQAQQLSTLSGFSVAAGASLQVSDSASNLLLGANAAGIAAATAVTLTGTANNVSAAQAASLTAFTGFTLGFGATLAVSDSASDLLSGADAAGVAKATKVTLTGANSVTAAQAAALSHLAGFSLAAGATLAVSDGASALLANPSGIAVATSVTLTGANDVSAAQAEQLSATTDFGLDLGASLVVQDSAAHLLTAGNAGGLADATAITLTGAANSVNASQVATLASLTNFSLAAGAILNVSDTAADLLAGPAAAGLALATSVNLTGTANAVTAAQAETLAQLNGFGLGFGATLAVSDNATDLLSAGSAAGMGFATNVTLTGASNSCDAAQAVALSDFAGFALAAGATLTVSDDATNLLAAGSALANATSVVLTGTSNVVNAAQAATLSRLHSVSLAAGATLMIADTAGDLLGASAAGLALATSVEIIGTSNNVTVAQASDLAAIPNLTIAAGATLVVSDTASDLLAAGNAAGLSLATSVLLTGTANQVSPSQAATLAALTNFSLAAGASLTVSGSSASIASALDSLQTLAAAGDITSITMTDGNPLSITAIQLTDDTQALAELPSNYQLRVAGVTAAGAAAVLADPHVISYAVADSAANLLAAGNQAAVAAATSVTLTGANQISAAAATTLAGFTGFSLAAGATLVIADSATDLLAAGSAAGETNATAISVTGANSVTATQAASLAALPHVSLAAGASLVVSDSAIDLLAGANASGIALATSVRLTGANSVTAAQAETLSGLTGFALAAGATLAISDSAPDLLLPGNSAGLAAATSVTLTGANSVTAAQATQLADLADFSKAAGATLAVTNNAANLLNAAYAAGLTAATSVTLSGANSEDAAQAQDLAVLNNFSLAVGTTLVISDDATNLLDASNARGVGFATGVILTGSNDIGAAEAATLAALPDFSRQAGATLIIFGSGAALIAAESTLGFATSVILTGANSLDAADASELANSPGFSLASGATLGVADSASNLLLPGSAAGEAAATSVELTGTSNNVDAGAADQLAALTGFSLATGASLIVTDDATNLLDAGNAAGLAIASAVVLSGASNSVDAQDATTLAGLPGFSLASGATLTVSDDAANLLTSSYASGLAAATNVLLTGAASLDAADAGTLGALPDFALAAGATLAVSDDATNLLTYAARLAAATSVTLTGTSNAVDAADMAVLADLPDFALGIGSTLAVSDSASGLITNFAALADATSVVITGDNVVTAADATSLASVPGISLAAGATLEISDSASALLDPSNAAGIAFATGIELSGTANSVDAADATILAGLSGFALAAGATLMVADSAADLLNAAYASGIAAATGLLLTGANSLDAADAGSLAGLGSLSLAPGATLVVSDDAANLLAGANLAGVADATSVTLTGTNAVNAGQATALATFAGFNLAAGASLVITDTAAHLLAPANAAGEAFATSVILSGTANIVTAAQAAILAGLTDISLALHARLTIADNAADLLAASAGALALATAVTLAGTANLVTATGATTLAGMTDFSLAFGASLTVSDDAANLLDAGNAAGLLEATSVVLSGANAVDAAQAATLADLTNFSLADGASLLVSDNATDLLDSANAAGLGFATSVRLAGANSTNAAGVASLAALHGFGLAAGATLSVSDTAASLLTNNVSLATSVTLTGANLVNAPQAATLAAMPGFTEGAGATLVVSDSAAALLGNPTGTAIATSTVLTGTTNNLDAADATHLADLTGFNRDPAATLVITDTAADLLSGADAAGVAIATNVILTGSSNQLDAGSATLLAALPNFAIAAGADLIVADGASNLLNGAYAAGVAAATGVQLTGSNVVNAANAAALADLNNFSLASGASLTVTDSAADLLSGANAGGIAAASAVVLSGQSNNVTAAQSAQLAAMHDFTLAAGATLVIESDAVDLAALANRAGVALATSVILTGGGNAVNAAQAERLALLPNFSLGFGAALLVSDSAGNLLASANAGGVGFATSVVITGTANPVGGTQADQLAALPHAALAFGATLALSDNAGNLLAAGPGAALATSVTLTGANQIDAAQAETLAGMNGFAIGTSATMTVSDSAANLLLPANAAGVALATSTMLTGANHTGAASATELAGFRDFALNAGATLAVTDSASDLLAPGNAAGIILATSVTLSGTSNNISAAAAATLAALPNFTLASGATLVVTDSATDIVANITMLESLAVAGDLTSINLTGLSPLAVTYAEFTADTALFGTLPAGYSLTVSGVPAVAAATVSASAHVAAFSVTDTAANLLAPPNLAGLALATSVTLSGASNDLNAAQAEQLAGLPGFSLETGASLVVSDDAANLLANPGGCAIATSVLLTGASNQVSASQAGTLAALPGFALGAGSLLAVADDAANLLANPAGIAIATSVLLTGANDVDAAQATALAGLAGLALGADATLAVSDSAANLLGAGNAGGIAIATSVILTSANLVDAANATILAHDAGFALAAGATLAVADNAPNLLAPANAAGIAVATEVTLTGTSNVIDAAQAAWLAALPGFGLGAAATLTVSDNASGLLNDASGLAFATNVFLTGANSVTAAQAEALSVLPAFSLGTGATLAIFDNAANLLANLAGDTLGTSITLTGANNLDAANAEILTGFADVSLAAGATLTVTDTAANLLAGSNQAGVAFATSVTLSGSNQVNAAQAETLSGLPGFHLAAGATLVIADSAAHLLLAGNAGGEGFATGVLLTGTSNSVTAAQAASLAALPDFGLALHATLVVEDSAADLLSAPSGLGIATSVIVTGASNQVTAAQATSLAALPNFTLAFGAGLVVADNASDLLNPANAAGIALATGALLTGTNGASAAGASTLAALPNFALAAGATLAISDSAANLLNPADADGIGFATSVILTGANATNAAQATTLALLPDFTVVAGATLALSDGAADLLNPSLARGVAIATSVTLTGANSVNAAQADALAALPGFTLATGATLAVTDNAADLLSSANHSGIAVATSVVLTGSNQVTAGQAEQLSYLPHFSLAAGATMAVADSATNLLAPANAAGVSLATSVTLTGANVVNAAGASALAALAHFVLAPGASLQIADNAADLLALPSGPGEALATGITLTGVNSTNATQAVTLSHLTDISLAAGASLTVTDSAANLLADSAALVLATSVVLSGANLESAALATTLADLPHFHVGAGASLAVDDTAANLLAPANVAGVAIATSVMLTGTANNVNAVQADALAGLAAFRLAAGATLTVSDDAANLLSPANAEGLAFATSVILTGASNVVNAAQAAILAALPGFHLATGATLSVTDTAANLLATGNAAGVARATSVQLSGTTNFATAAQATALSGLPDFTLAAGAALVVSDTAGDLLNASFATGVAAATSIILVGTANSVTAAQATLLAALPNFTKAAGATLGVIDSAANILASGFAPGVAAATSVTMSGAANVVSVTQAMVLTALPNFALAAGATLTVSDSSATISANLPFLQSMTVAGDLTAIAISSGGPLAISYAEFIGDTAALSKLTGFFSLFITGVPAADAGAVAASLYISGFGVVDNAANLLAPANIAAVQVASNVALSGANQTTAAQAASLAALPEFTLGAGATLEVIDTAANLLASANAAGLALATGVTLTGTANSVTAAQAKILSADPGFSLGLGATLNVADTAAHLLLGTNAAGLALATSVTLTGSANDVTASMATTLAALPNFTLAAGATLLVADTAANLLANQAGDAIATRVSLIGTTNNVSAAAATELAGLTGFGLNFGATLVVSDSAADLLSPACSAGIGFATSVVLLGNANSVNAAQAAQLAHLPHFAVASGASLVVEDTAANLLAVSNAEGVAAATSVIVTGNANTLDAAFATSLADLHHVSLAPGATLVIADTAADLLLPASASGEALATSVTLTGVNAVTAAAATSLADLHSFSLAAGATLSVSDTASDLLANLPALAFATSVSVTGSSNQVTAAQATALAALPNFSLAQGANLVIEDSAADLLAPANAHGIAIATAVWLTGSNQVTAAQAVTLETLPNFAFAAGATLTIIDNAADLLSNPAAIAEASSVTLSGVNQTNAAGAAALAALPHFALGAGATLAVADDAGNLLANIAALGFATSVTLTGTNNQITAPQAGMLNSLQNFTIAAGATLLVSGDATDLLANLAALANATSVTLIGSANQTTAAQAAVLAALRDFTVAPGADLVVADSAANLLLAANSRGVGFATSVTLTGSNEVSAAGYAMLAVLPHFALAFGATLTVADNATDLLANGSGFDAATSVSLTGANTTTAGQAAALARLPHFSVGAGASLVVADNAADLLSETIGLGFATAVNLIGTANIVTVAQTGQLAAMHGFNVTPGATLVVADTAFNLLWSASAADVSLGTSTELIGSNTVLAWSAARLASLPGFFFGAGATLVVSDIAENLLWAPNAAGVALATSTVLTGTANIQSAANADRLMAMHNFSIAAGATLVVSDSAANLLAAQNATGLAIATSISLTGYNVVSAAQALTLTGLPNLTYAPGAQLVVSDTAADLSTTIDQLQTLVAAGDISSIQISDNNPLSITYTQFVADSAVLAKLPGSYKVNVSNVQVANVGPLWSNWHVNTLSVNDTAANIDAAIAPLDQDLKISALTASGTSGGDTLNLTGFAPPASINLGADPAHAVTSLNAPTLSFIGTPDAITLGTGHDTIQYALTPSSGIETIAGFTYGLDQLNINLLGALTSTLQAFNTTVNGVHAISIMSTANPSEGVVLLGMLAADTAANLMASHLSFVNGIAIVT